MRTFIIGFIVFSVWTLFTRWYYVCKVEFLCDEKQESTIIDTNVANKLDPRTKDLQLLAKEEVVLNDYEQFGFNINDASLNTSASNDDFLQGVAKYMKDNKEAKLRITGSYLSTEDKPKNTRLGNFGLVRASAIRDVLVKKYKVGKNRFDLAYNEEADSSAFLARPASFLILLPEKGKEIVTTDYSFDNMTFLDANFESNSYKFTPGPNFVLYADSVKIHLQKNKDAKLLITGHTDSQGNQSANNTLGQKRAGATRDYFVNTLGIDSRRIEIASKGQTAPIADNNTEQGRRKNRRINIVIK